eukprot:7692686-Ditylum_brightwellii.AAC.1
MARVGSNSKKFAVAAMARSKTAAMATTNQESDAKPFKKKQGAGKKEPVIQDLCDEVRRDAA